MGKVAEGTAGFGAEAGRVKKKRKRRKGGSERSSKRLLYKSDVSSLAVLKSFVSH